ncbi:MAG: radical SAM protein [bacterium]
MVACRHCGKKAKTISYVIGFCADCIREHFSTVWHEIKKVHDSARLAYGFPTDHPRDANGVPCRQCFHACEIAEDSTGYCGIRKAADGKLRGGRPHEGNLSYYYDPLPTNCVADFVCPGGTGCGYPKYAVSPRAEYGRKNLAVFYHACTFNCLYCQNYHFKEWTFSQRRVTTKELADAVDDATTCVCYFGGDPTPQILHALGAANLALKRRPNGILRICWETNGAMEKPYLNKMAEISMNSGGCIKFDLKAWDEGIHYALCGVTNKKTLDNFAALAELARKRTEPPFLIASTLLVPGYVDEKEVGAIAHFIAGLNIEIPYSLLAFYPHFYLNDLPTTSRSHAALCKEAAESAGLRKVRIGNLHLLGNNY